MHCKQVPFAEARLYIGSVRGYKGQPYTEGHLIRLIQDFQRNWNDKNDWTVAVRITKTNFVCMDYQEAGWEVTGINYPRFPRTNQQLRDFFTELREHMMIELGQNRVTVTFDFVAHSDQSTRCHEMAEREDAEQTHR